MTTGDIAEVIRRAADAVPAAGSDLDAVLRRHRRNRRRRTTAALGAVAVTAAAAITAVVAINPGGPAVELAVQRTTQADSAPETLGPKQRLPLNAGWALGPDKNGGQVTVPQVRALYELGADRQLDGTPVPEIIDDVRAWVPLDDGRSVVLGGKNLKPGVSREDGPDVSDFAIRLLVLDAGGQVGLQREVRVQGQDVELLGATATTAYLYRTPGRIMAHDLATGAEHRLTGLEPVPSWETHSLTVQGGLLLAAPHASCGLRAVALDTGKQLFATYLPCAATRVMRLSPDGRTLAVALSDPAGVVTLFRIDVATGKVGTTPVTRGERSGVLGVGWAGGTVRVAWLRLPSTGAHPLSEELRITDL
ncbi:hypothetical protein AB0J72_20025 [Dactylosporangium sp. NPDC049742]|uniref:hypothetical protein n=1 Tax=Dactylosporangium sp. NPDC049742 TaxID=3154737 RepID=UPI003445EC57